MTTATGLFAGEQAADRSVRRLMSRWNIAIAAGGGCEAAAEAICSHLSEAWSAERGATFGVRSFDEITPKSIRKIDAVVLAASENANRSHVLRVLSVCEEEFVPVLAVIEDGCQLRKVFAQSGALVEESASAAEIICAKLHALLHRQGEVMELRQEVALATRFHGGLRGEMAKIHEELQLAAIVQREYLPRKLPTLHGVSVAAMWRPANYVSGDIYEVVQLDDDHLGLFLADAVGHGVPAALMTMVICQSLAMHERKGSELRIIAPSEVMRRLNADMIRRQDRSSRFVTAVYAVINCRSRVMTIAGAGHPPPLVFHADGRSTQVETEGGLLGIFKDEEFAQVEIELELDDRVMLYSDGFEQAFPEKTADGYEQRLPTVIYRDEFARFCGQGTPQESIDQISARIDMQSGSLHQADDLTLICLHAGPLPRDEAPVDAAQSCISWKS